MKSLQQALLIGIGLFLFILAPVRGDEALAQQPPPSNIKERLTTIFVSVDFINASLNAAVQALAAAGRQHDPEGIQFVISPDAAATAKPITLKLDGVPMNVALRYICELGSVRYKIHDTSVEVSSRWGTGGCGMESRTFHVDPSFVKTAETAGIIPKTPQPPQ